MKDDPRERWCMVPETDGIYTVSDLGRVRREVGGRGAVAGRILRPGLTPQGHPIVNLSVGGLTRSVHVATMVAHAFLPTPASANPVLVYADGDPTNCRATNLSWTDQAEINRREKWYRKLPDDAIEAIQAAKGRESARDLAARYNVSRQAIYGVWKRQA